MKLGFVHSFLVLDAGEAAVPPVCDPLLVEGDVGHKPGGLQEEDRGQGDGTTNAEGLQSRQDLQITFTKLHLMCKSF